MAMREIKGESYGKSEMAMPSKSDKFWPHVSIPMKVLPEAKDWKVGQEYVVTLKLRQTGMHMSKGSHGDHGSAEFDIIGIDPSGKMKESKKEKPKRYVE